MKTLIMLAIVATFATAFLLYRRDKEIRKLCITWGSFSLMLYLLWVGFRVSIAIFPLKIATLLLGVFSWGALLYYMFRRRYLWWAIYAPLLVPLLFILFSLLGGSRYEDLWKQLF